MDKLLTSDARPTFPWLEKNPVLIGVLTAILLFLFSTLPADLSRETNQQQIQRLGPVVADLKVNGSDGPVLLQPGEPYTYYFDSANAASCEVISPYPSGSTLQGASSPVRPGELHYYPTFTSPITLTFSCRNDRETSIDSIRIQLDPRRLMLASILWLPGWRT